MRVSADRNVCIGAGLCALTAPEVFDQDDDGLVELLTPDPERRPSSRRPPRQAASARPARSGSPNNPAQDRARPGPGPGATDVAPDQVGLAHGPTLGLFFNLMP